MGRERVSTTVDKYYAQPAGSAIAVSLPLAQLFFLEEGEEMKITAVSGTERIIKLQDDHSTSQLFAFRHKLHRAGRFRHLCELASRIEIRQFVRPRDSARFAEGVDMVANCLSPSGSQ